MIGKDKRTVLSTTYYVPTFDDTHLLTVDASIRLKSFLQFLITTHEIGGRKQVSHVLKGMCTTMVANKSYDELFSNEKR